MSAVRADDRMNRHLVTPTGVGSRGPLQSPRSDCLLRRYRLLCPFADELDAFDQGMELVLSDVTLQQNKTAIGRDAQPIRRDDLQESRDPIRHLRRRLGDRALDVDNPGPEIDIVRQRKLLEGVEARHVVDAPAAILEIENVDARFISLRHDRARRRRSVRLLLAFREVVDLAGLARFVRHNRRAFHPSCPNRHARRCARS